MFNKQDERFHTLYKQFLGLQKKTGLSIIINTVLVDFRMSWN